MDNPQKDRTEEIMRYLDNRMTENERLDFEAEMKHDIQLSAEVGDLVMARDAVKLFGINNDVSRIRKEAPGNIKQETPVIKMPPYRKLLRYSIAAAASVLLLFFAARFFDDPLSTADQFYNEGYSRYEIPALRGTGTTLSAAEQAYLTGNYTEVINLYHGETGHTPGEMLIAGIACLETGKASEAIEIFSALRDKGIAENTNSFRDEAEYYLALAYLKNNNYTSAIPLMEKISADKNNPYHRKFTAGYISGVKKL
ncbi:MAG: hypothetical protein WKF88_03580 [Ferruginibacter sp.]